MGVFLGTKRAEKTKCLPSGKASFLKGTSLNSVFFSLYTNPCSSRFPFQGVCLKATENKKRKNRQVN